MKKILLSAIVFAALTFSAFAQSPEAFKYQAVVRDASQNVIPNQAVGMQLTIFQTSATGTMVYQETFAPTSNAYGLVNLEIGTGTVVSGTFASIDWSAGPYFIETAMDATGGTTYVVMGTSQLLSVPYALHANVADSAVNGTAGPQGPAGVAGPTGTTGATGVAGPTGPAGSANISGTTNNIIKFTGATTGGNSQLFDDGTNVGIGTTTPTEKLSIVNGSLYTNGEGNGVIVGAAGFKGVGLMKYFGRETILVGNAASAVSLSFGRWSGGTIKAPTSVFDDLVISGTGNIGIGTTAPKAKLHFANNLASGPLDNFSEYSILLWENATGVESYGMGVRSGTFVLNTDFNFNFDVKGVTVLDIDANGIVEEAWQNATLLNGWTDFGGGYASSQYYKDKEGVIHVKGVITAGTTAVGTIIFNLPAGYRPTERRIISTLTNGANNGTPTRIDVMPNGDVFIYGSNVSSVWLNMEFSFRP